MGANGTGKHPALFEDYQLIVCQGNPVSLVDAVKALLLKGWIPLGGISTQATELRDPKGALFRIETVWTQALGLPVAEVKK